MNFRLLLFLISVTGISSSAQVPWIYPDTLPGVTGVSKLDARFLVYRSGASEGLLDHSGKVVTSAYAAAWKALGHGWYAFQDTQSGLWGTWRLDGRVVQAPVFAQVELFREGYSAVAYRDMSRTTYNLMDTFGLTTLQGRMAYLSGVFEGLCVFRRDSMYGYIRPDGQVSIAPSYHNAQPFQFGMAAVYVKGKGWGLLDPMGNWLLPPAYEQLEPVSELLVKFKRGQFWGLMDRRGYVISEPRYQLIGRPSDRGLMMAKRGDFFGFLSSSGDEIGKFEYRSADGFSLDGFARVEWEGKIGYINLLGLGVIPPVYDGGLSFSEGLVAVRKAGKWGYLNTSGMPVLPFQYDQAGAFESGRAVVQSGGELLVINRSGQVLLKSGATGLEYVLTSTHLIGSFADNYYLLDLLRGKATLLPYDMVGNFREGLAVVRKMGQFGFIDLSGKLVIGMGFEGGVQSFQEGLASVRNIPRGMVYFINRQGERVVDIPEDCLYAGNFSGGLCRVRCGGLGGYMDSRGRMVVSPAYADFADFVRGFAVVGNERGRVGLIDRRGGLVLPMVYEGMGDMGEEGLIAVRSRGLWGYADQRGNEVIPTIYEQTAGFSGGVCAVRRDGKAGYLDRAGREVVPLIFEEVGPFGEELVAVKFSGKWGYTNLKGKGALVIPAIYDRASDFREGRCWVQKAGLTGALNRRGEEVIPFTYSDAGPFRDGMAYVVRNGLRGMVDIHGGVVVPTVCLRVGTVSEGSVVVQLRRSGYAVFALGK